jgi:5-methylcytosine-specific restriction enzyme A
MASRLRSLPNRIALLDTRSAKLPPKRADPFYLSPEWRDLVADLLRLRGRRCQQCGRTNTRIYADHILELADGGARLDHSNVQLLCGACHTRKSQAERARRQAQRYT